MKLEKKVKRPEITPQRQSYFWLRGYCKCQWPCFLTLRHKFTAKNGIQLQHFFPVDKGRGPLSMQYSKCLPLPLCLPESFDGIVLSCTFHCLSSIPLLQFFRYRISMAQCSKSLHLREIQEALKTHDSYKSSHSGVQPGVVKDSKTCPMQVAS